MSSTLPKSIIAQAGSNTGGDDRTGSTSGTPANQTQHFREFIERIKHIPDDFLRIPSTYYPQQEQVIRAMSRTPIMSTREAPLVDMIEVSVVEAQLVKNYGLMRMDLYCKIRVGHMVCETQTCINGAKNPKWDGSYQFTLKPGIDSFHLEIYDEKQFSLDEKVAWLHEPIPPEIFQGITVERWFPLTGRLGQNKEGSVLLVISHKRAPMRSSNFARTNYTQHGGPIAVFVPTANQGPILQNNGSMMQSYVQPPLDPAVGAVHPSGNNNLQQQLSTESSQAGPRTIVSDEDVNQISEIFPSVDKAIIKEFLENHNNNKDACVGNLLGQVLYDALRGPNRLQHLK